MYLLKATLPIDWWNDTDGCVYLRGGVDDGVQ